MDVEGVALEEAEDGRMMAKGEAEHPTRSLRPSTGVTSLKQLVYCKSL